MNVALRVLGQVLDGPGRGNVLVPTVEELIDRSGVVEVVVAILVDGVTLDTTTVITSSSTAPFATVPTAQIPVVAL